MKKYLIILLLFTSCKKEPNLIPSKSTFHFSKVVIDGNSLGAGYLSSFGGYQKMFIDSGYKVINTSIGGQTTLQMINNCQDVNSALQDSALLIVEEITNDLYYGATPDSAFNRIKKYCLDKKLLYPNIKIALITPTPRSNPGTPSNFESNRQIVIELIKHDNSFYDYLVNAGEDPNIGKYNSQYNSLYYIDLVHHTDYGYVYRGNLIFKSLN